MTTHNELRLGVDPMAGLVANWQEPAAPEKHCLISALTLFDYGASIRRN